MSELLTIIGCLQDSAAQEIQRHIKGFLARKRIRPLLASRLESVVKRNDPGNPD